jgi:ubiquinone/menaquinone biosynthesis C-methylase UbiE
MLKAVDYNENQHAVYAKGRALDAASTEIWLELYEKHGPRVRPARVLDLGSGTGRFTPLLAQVFGGPIYGVEPSDKMRATAEAQAAGPAIAYLAGRAEAIPLEDDSVDLVLTCLSFHHVRDRATAVAEIARVLKPGGRYLSYSPYSDRFPDIHWHRFFPEAREVEKKMFPPLAEIEALFAAVGLKRISLTRIKHSTAPSLAAFRERLSLRAISTFEHMSEDDIQRGFARLDEAVAAETEPQTVFTEGDLLVLEAAS